ncbi:MAG TPA: hypothetical protein VK208_18635 [Pyrinomonadaceae bacterium]|nr:hypothetical protein [Pyrinomonadaceae bacterium]
MRQLLTSTLLIFLIFPCSVAGNTSSAQNAATQNPQTTSTKARPGFYLEIKRSYIRAYPGWQKETIDLLRARGFDAFNGNPKNQTSVDRLQSMESLEQVSKPTLIISSVYVGPYKSRKTAERMVPRLLLALKPLIDAEKKNDELNSRYLFLVGVVVVTQG